MARSGVSQVFGKLRRMSTPEDVATLRTRVETLNKAIARGARSVTLGDQTIIYNTTESLIKARNDMQALLTAAERKAAPVKASRQNYAVYGGRSYD